MSNYEIIRIRENTWRVENDTVRFFLFEGKKKALLVDSGKTLHNTREIVEGLTELPVILVNTHVDFDHIACNDQFDEAYMHPSEFSLYRKARKMTGILKPLWEGDVLDLGGRYFEVIHIPGHTPGSIALLDTGNRILVGGDSVQDGKIFLFGGERDLNAYLYSLKKLQSYSNRFDQVYPSHSTFPVGADTVDKLVFGVEEILAGKVPASPAMYLDTQIKSYDIGVATILYDHDIDFPMTQDSV